MQTKIYTLLSITALSLSLLGSHASAADAPSDMFFYDDVPLRGSQGFYIGSTAGFSIAEGYDATVSVSGAGSVTQKDFLSSNIGIHTMANLGYHLTEDFRLQADFGYLSHKIDEYNFAGVQLEGHGDYRMLYVLGLLAYDIPSNWGLKPYIGAGFGYGYVEGQEPGDGKFSDGTWVAKASAGIGYALTDNLDLVADYSYLFTGDVNTAKGEVEGRVATNSIALRTHTVNMGLRYNF